MVSTDTKELLTSYALSFVEGYKVLLACLLSVFVPQYCPETGTTCTLSDNFSNLSAFNEAVVVINFLCLGMFVYLSVLQSRRETYLITHLDATPTQAVTAFAANLARYPKILRRVQEHNAKLYTLVRYTICAFIVNAVSSAILVTVMYYDGFRTATTLIANILLVAQKLYGLFDILHRCRASAECPLALSAYQITPVGYNVVDEDYASTTTPAIEMTDTAQSTTSTTVEMTGAA
jgi:hypothetical protein